MTGDISLHEEPTVPVVWLSLHPHIQSKGPWDTTLLQDLFADQLWPIHFRFDEIVADEVPAGVDRAVVVLPARHHADDASIVRLNGELAKLTAGLLILVGDEEAIFPWKRVQHPNMRIWVMLPNPTVHQELEGYAFFFGDGYTPDTKATAQRAIWGDKDIPWAFAGQATTARRKHAVNGLLQAMHRTPDARLLQTEGFSRGMPRDEYLQQLSRTRVAPAPGGPQTPDTFRAFEALELGCVPILDAYSDKGWPGYWDFLYREHRPPMPIVESWDGIGKTIEDLLGDWDRQASFAGAWWKQEKVRIAQRLVSDLIAIGFPGPAPQITVVMTSSPSPLHPDGQLTLETLESVRHMPKWVIGFDGVRDEQQAMAGPYYQYVQSMVRASQQDEGVNLYVASRHLHQANMTRELLEMVDTPLILFMEHDTPLDETLGCIPWDDVTELIAGGHLDVLRFHHEGAIHPEHEHLMIDHVTEEMVRVPLRRTVQWSQRPHVARTDYYRRIIAEHFPHSSSTMIEDRMHSVAQSEPYERNRIAIYHPDGNIRRSLHLDGRRNQPKFPMRFQ